MTEIRIPVSPGELVDRITILDIKRELLPTAEARDAADWTWQRMRNIQKLNLEMTHDVHKLASELREINKQLWDVEDAIRIHEKQQRFDIQFVFLARQVYRLNDRRCELKKHIDNEYAEYAEPGEVGTEPKSYPAYG